MCQIWYNQIVIALVSAVSSIISTSRSAVSYGDSSRIGIGFKTSSPTTHVHLFFQRNRSPPAVLAVELTHRVIDHAMLQLELILHHRDGAIRSFRLARTQGWRHRLLLPSPRVMNESIFDLHVYKTYSPWNDRMRNGCRDDRAASPFRASFVAGTSDGWTILMTTIMHASAVDRFSR